MIFVSFFPKANDGIPVYKVRLEDGEERTRILHRNLFQPIGSNSPPPVVIPRKRRNKAPISIITKNDSDSDSKFSYVEMKIPKLPPI